MLARRLDTILSNVVLSVVVQGRSFAFTFFGVFLLVVPMNEGPGLDGIEGGAEVRYMDCFSL